MDASEEESGGPGAISRVAESGGLKPTRACMHALRDSCDEVLLQRSVVVVMSRRPQHTAGSVVSLARA